MGVVADHHPTNSFAYQSTTYATTLMFYRREQVRVHSSSIVDMQNDFAFRRQSGLVVTNKTAEEVPYVYQVRPSHLHVQKAYGY